MASSVIVILITLSILNTCQAKCVCIGEDWNGMEGVGCFRYFLQPKTFMEAEKNCNRYSRLARKLVHLASIHSEEENDIVTAMIPESTSHYEPRVFIGLRSNTNETAPAWTDGSFYDYQHWWGEPDSVPYGEVYISGGYWFRGLWMDATTTFEEQYTYICKAPCMDN